MVKASYEAVEYTKISTEAELKAMGSTGYYVLTNDITLTEIWTPIAEFSGTLDGCGYIIKNINTEIIPKTPCTIENDKSGFFISLTGTVINTGFEIALSNEGVKESYMHVGAIADKATGARIENCYVSGTINYNTQMGMSCGVLADEVEDTIIKNCYTNVEANITTADEFCTTYFAGLVRYADGGGIYTSYSNTVSNEQTRMKDYACGMISSSSEMENCYFNKDRYNGSWPSGYEGTVATTEKLKTLSYFYNGVDHNLDFVKVWNLDSEVNGGLPSLKMFGTNQATATTESVKYENGKLKATVKFSQPVVGTVFTVVTANGKTQSAQQKTDADVFESVEISVDAKTQPEEVKILVWENLTSIKPIVMETISEIE